MQENLTTVKVGMADLNIVEHPGMITTLGLGSCIGIALYDKVTKIAGLAHIMLPDSTKIKNNSNKYKFADTAIEILLEEMVKKGAKKLHIVAKIAGGAKMFDFDSTDDLLNVGKRNAMACKEALEKLNINLIAEDTGLNYGRTVELYTEDGRFKIKTIGKGESFI